MINKIKKKKICVVNSIPTIKDTNKLILRLHFYDLIVYLLIYVMNILEIFM